MIKITLQTLALRNFKGAASQELAPSGADLSIYGQNAAGKTTIADAYFWALFGKDSRGRKDFEIKTINSDGTQPHNLEHQVSATLAVDGRLIDLSRCYHEVWTKSRGKALAEMSGHTTDYKINGVPTNERQYQDQIASILPEKKWRLLSDPTAFSVSLTWQERRATLLEMCGDITDADVIAANPQLQDLPNILGRHTADEYKKIAAATRKTINEQLSTIPARIDELNRTLGALPTSSDVQDVAPLREQLAKLAADEANIRAGGHVATLNVERSTYVAKIAEEEAKNRLTASQGVIDLEQSLNSVRSSERSTQTEIDSLDSAINVREASLKVQNIRLEALRAKYHEISSAEAPVMNVTSECPTCHQALPEEQVQAAREKRLSDWNNDRAERLTANRSEGKLLKGTVDKLVSEIDDLRSQRNAASAILSELVAKRERFTGDLEAEKARPQASTTTEPVALQQARISLAAVDAQIASLRDSAAEELARLATAKISLETQIQSVERVTAQLAERDRANARINELGLDQRRLAGELESADRAIYLIEEFTRTKVSLLTDRINSRFKLAKFKLFDEQVNGGLAETCECMVDGVPYSDLNTGARLNVGLDIINTLAEHYGVCAPIVIDNAESVTSILPTHGQQIRLIVSADDSELRIESAAADLFALI